MILSSSRHELRNFLESAAPLAGDASSCRPVDRTPSDVCNAGTAYARRVLTDQRRASRATSAKQRGEVFGGDWHEG